MITWLTKQDFKDFVENRAKIGKYISHCVVNKKITPAVDDLHFSDAVIKVNILEKGKTTPTAIYLNNLGIVKIQGDTYKLFTRNVEYDFYWFHEHLVNCNFEFASMMIEKFKKAYLQRRVKYCSEEICECLEDKEIYITNAELMAIMLKQIRERKEFLKHTNIETADSYFNKNTQKTKMQQNQEQFKQRLKMFYPNMKNILPPQITKGQAELLEKDIEMFIEETMDELNYSHEYTLYQQAMTLYLIDEYENLGRKNKQQENNLERI